MKVTSRNFPDKRTVVVNAIAAQRLEGVVVDFTTRKNLVRVAKGEMRIAEALFSLSQRVVAGDFAAYHQDRRGRR